ncbi:tetratricopeptide repeat protein [Streptomyces sp. NPDC052020]|uniref:tetratricopeptide repeat protein n=1 Tax=Streptomyces sp. NPDC052020 TaxID=3155677 RepID=UPI00341490A1
MARLSRDSKRNRPDTGPAAGPPTAPVDVRVPGAVSDTAPGARPGAAADASVTSVASVDGVPIAAAPGQEAQHAVLAHLHRVALSTGRPVLATVHDDRIGYIVPLRVDPDGSSHFTAEPVRTAPPREAAAPSPDPSTGPSGPAGPPPPPRGGAAPTPRPAESGPPPGPEASTSDGQAPASPPAFPPPAGVFGPAAGEFGPPTGEFGPPPRRDALPGVAGAATAPVAPFVPERPEGARDPKPAPVRGFDAVAEAVLGEDPHTTPGDGSAPDLLAEPTARINEAVRTGRTDAAALLAEQTVARASRTLGSEHPEVLRLRELTAYIAYLSDDPVRALRVSLDLARIHRRAGDAEAAYGSLHGAVTAWRAVRDPQRGMELGHDLIGLWAGLVADGGPAAEEAERLESARARMGRLTERARARRPEQDPARPPAETAAPLAR